MTDGYEAYNALGQDRGYRAPDLLAHCQTDRLLRTPVRGQAKAIVAVPLATAGAPSTGNASADRSVRAMTLLLERSTRFRPKGSQDARSCGLRNLGERQERIVIFMARISSKCGGRVQLR